MYCSACGGPVTPGLKFCNRCGTGLSKQTEEKKESGVAGGLITAVVFVAPFDVRLPSDAGFYVVAPEQTADTPKIAQFRDWMISAAKEA